MPDTARDSGHADTVRVLLVDDHAAFREPLAFMLNRHPGFEVVAQAGTVAEAEPSLALPGVAVIDLHLPDGDGIELVRRLRAVNPRCRALLLTASESLDDRARAVEAGADGVLNKSSSIAEVTAAIEGLAAGGALLGQNEIIDLLRHAARSRDRDWGAKAALERLTPRERQVLEAVSRGLSDKEIALELSVSHETVRTHMVNILGKLGVESRLQALLMAVRHGMIELQ